ncbi:uncharacterized protein LOC115624604 isoform X2 [Scaptodrosophila lebanonensis]|uniref:Uncharacterized protein LOC115624604 isoform X2 n=1 Tax=Drosophila lebanonensis TaxID=7225 RepID=A0A6J2TIF2_DROLE|nr:uncharacterized protein LOC115624604 isoform X2 [Scaptodrosophila lebanonensis]
MNKANDNDWLNMHSDTNDEFKDFDVSHIPMEPRTTKGAITVQLVAPVAKIQQETTMENEAPGRNLENSRAELDMRAIKSTTTCSIPAITTQSKQDPCFERMQRDLNSPSAFLRARAIRALKSPSKAAYTQFDVPHEEQSIITTEERNPPAEPTLADILKDVIVYVEVRSGVDNRSEGVKTVIAKMGAQVNDRLLRTTTHVVFKDGLLSTYKKACSWNVPVVSILWIEACKMHRKLCPPEMFPISNKHLYEYPELFPKLSRVRCIQPGAELNRRPRKRVGGTPTGSKDVEREKTAIKKANTTSETTTPTSTPTSRQKKDITHFFKPLSLTKQIHAICDEASAESPATKLLNRISSGQFTPVQTASKQKQEHVDDNGSGDSPNVQPPNKPRTKRSLSFAETRSEGPMTRRRSSVGLAPVTTPAPMTRRSSSLHVFNNTLDNKTVDGETIPEPRLTRRRSLMSLGTNSVVEPSTPKVCKKPSVQSIAEETLAEPVVKNVTNCMEMSLEVSVEQSAAIVPKQRATVYTLESMEISNVHCRSVFTSSTDLANLDTPAKGSDRNLLTNVMTQTSIHSTDGEHTPVPVFSSTRLPGSAPSRRSIYSVDIELINERINSINKSSQRRSLAMMQQDNLPPTLNKSSRDTPLAVAQPSTVDANHTNNNTAEVTPSQPKMRKLFTPNEEIIFSPPKSCKKSRPSLCATMPNSSTNKRRRTLAAAPATPSTDYKKKEVANTMNGSGDEAMLKAIQLKTLGRRSTLDFEQANSGKAPPPTENIVQSNNEDAKATDEDNDTTERFMTPVGSEEKITANTEEKPPPKKRRRISRTLVHTNMHQEQIQVIHQAIRKIRGVRLDPTVGPRTTHLISLEPRRTLNLLRGLMRGVWIVTYNWILDSVRAGKWVNEEAYELTSFSRAVEICRTERQAFGVHYRCELFRYMESFYVSSLCRPVHFNNMKELLLLGGATLTENRYKAKYVIGDKRRAEDDRIYLSPYWVLDSISAMQIQKFGKYIMKSAIVTPVGIIYENPQEMRITYQDPEFIIDK